MRLPPVGRCQVRACSELDRRSSVVQVRHVRQVSQVRRAGKVTLGSHVSEMRQESQVVVVVAG